jgi:hypothetical protein
MTVLLCAAASSATAEIAGGELIHFVRSYLDASERDTPKAEVDHYAERVRYFDDGMVNKDFVIADQHRYYRLWPERSFELLEGPAITAEDGDATTLKFTIRYDLGGAGRRARGTTENTMTVRRFGEGLKIVAMSERKLHPRASSRESEKPRAENRPSREQPAVPRMAPSPSPSSRKPGSVPRSTQNSDTKSAVRPLPPLPERQITPRDAPEEQRGNSRDELGVSKPSSLTPERATPVPNAPGFVYPPGTAHIPNNMIDVRGMSAGQKVKDPRTGQVFIVP